MHQNLITCQSRQNAQKLIEIRQGLKSLALGRFIEQLFADNDIAKAFLQLPASTQHHHNEIGGLLAHSVEVAEIMSGLSYDSPGERQIAIVAGLLHDIGKVRTLKSNLTPTQTGKMVSHDHLTLEVCAEALKALDKTWSAAADTLRHVWTCASPGAKYGYQANCSIAHKLRYADKESVRKYEASKLFKLRDKADGLVWNEHQQSYIWRPTVEPKLNHKRIRHVF